MIKGTKKEFHFQVFHFFQYKKVITKKNFVIVNSVNNFVATSD